MHNKAMALDSELQQHVKVHQFARNNADAFGIELELEGRGLVPAVPQHALWDYFTTHEDNSLRVIREDGERIEYVFKQPFDYDTTIKATKILFDHLNSDKAEVFESYRTSLHVHVNCGRESMRTIYNFITLSLMFDELFSSTAAKHRIGNNFCLRARDAQYQIEELIMSIQGHSGPWALNSNHRYSSINFVSLNKFGTIEFRIMECMTDFKRAKHWIDTLQALKAAARNFTDPRDVIKNFSKYTLEEFMTVVLGDCAPYYMRQAEWQPLLVSGMRLSQDFAFCSQWKTQVPKVNPQEAKPPKFGKAAHDNGAFADMMMNMAAQGDEAAKFWVNNNVLIHDAIAPAPLNQVWINELDAVPDEDEEVDDILALLDNDDDVDDDDDNDDDGGF
jgi:hypothetical protein